jgi:hypothetical protein
MTPEEYRKAVEPYATALRMVEDVIGELFGPLASLPSPDDVPLPKPEQRAEAIITALQWVARRTR